MRNCWGKETARPVFKHSKYRQFCNEDIASALAGLSASTERKMFQPLALRLRNWRLRQATRRKLAMLDDRLLADIGTQRDTIGDFIARRADETEGCCPCWTRPIWDRLRYRGGRRAACWSSAMPTMACP